MIFPLFIMHSTVLRVYYFVDILSVFDSVAKCFNMQYMCFGYILKCLKSFLDTF